MKSTLWFFFLDKWNFGNRTFDSILFVLSIREIFDSATSRDHAMKFWKLIWSKGSRLKISFHAQLLDLDCFSNRNLTKFSKVRLRRVNLQARSINLHQIDSHHQTRVTRSIPRYITKEASFSRENWGKRSGKGILYGYLEDNASKSRLSRPIRVPGLSLIPAQASRHVYRWVRSSFTLAFPFVSNFSLLHYDGRYTLQVSKQFYK